MTYPNTTYPNTPRHIDIPVKLDDVNAVFSVAALSFEGDMAASLSAPGAPLVPPVANLRASSDTTGVAVAQATIDEGVATKKPGDLVQAVQDAVWQRAYPDSVS